ncbi:FAR1 DNA binding domain, Zinc finger, SWIM-type, MULE transposase domain, FHY3/FAR1 family [Artemisia annua]|uniref:FAR1 DNA binding domain, Zinc finger, SWIM-type, MULE transposase domain, FHY3/FAR1 family n=1 Tax=Artemisia annua TaxID=35608 RepID=A0A2U1LR54_ARTAN|nr:FAR1 DNA binding domain, Zinc finger, SWIM-type, MULE transposase domain, FHY3/FAR1 family [Artemisia annua]
MLKEEDIGVMNSLRQVFLYQASQVNLGSVKGFHLLRQIYGDYDFVGVSSIDCKNYRRDMLDFIGKNDAQMLVEMLMKKKDFLPNFSFEYQTSENNALTNLFWADAYTKRNCYAFGDVMSFDATFRTDNVVGCQRFAQHKNDHDSLYIIQDMHTELQIEKEASKLYTRSIFFDVQTEIYAFVISCMSVLCKPAEDFYQCSCKRFESYGLLCRHIFYVLRFSNVKNFPKKYVLKRWSKDSLPPPSVIQVTGDSPDMISREIFSSVEYCVNRYANDPELLQKFRDHQVQLMAKADADVPIPTKTNKRDRIASILGVSQPEETIVNVPKQVNT